jgi:hypothetical protein
MSRTAKRRTAKVNSSGEPAWTLVVEAVTEDPSVESGLGPTGPGIRPVHTECSVAEAKQVLGQEGRREEANGARSQSRDGEQVDSRSINH